MSDAGVDAAPLPGEASCPAPKQKDQTHSAHGQFSFLYIESVCLGCPSISLTIIDNYDMTHICFRKY
jgi:hypothetical protein